jgi:hypothetical protein
MVSKNSFFGKDFPPSSIFSSKTDEKLYFSPSNAIIIYFAKKYVNNFLQKCTKKCKYVNIVWLYSINEIKYSSINMATQKSGIAYTMASPDHLLLTTIWTTLFMICSIAYGRIGLMRYCHPALPLIRDYDQRKGTKLYETLRTYTLTGFNQNQTADILYLHRNTLNSRRQKIIELSATDLEDLQTKFLLSYSFAIDLFLEKGTLNS